MTVHTRCGTVWVGRWGRAMDRRGAAIGVAVIAIACAFWPSLSIAKDAADNRRTCLSGKYPALCDMSMLSPSETSQAISAARRENLRLCLEGKYSALCKHDLLALDEAARVRNAEASHNLNLCLAGKYKALCKHELLTHDELTSVRSAERRENLKTCLNGNYAALCDHSVLSANEAQQVSVAEGAAQERKAQVVAASPSLPATPSRRATGYSAGCDSGHWVGSVTDGGRIVILENREVWEINPVDRIDTMLWLPTTSITVCDDQLINTDDGETAEARLLAR